MAAQPTLDGLPPLVYLEEFLDPASRAALMLCSKALHQHAHDSFMPPARTLADATVQSLQAPRRWPVYCHGDFVGQATVRPTTDPLFVAVTVKPRHRTVAVLPGLSLQLQVVVASGFEATVSFDPDPDVLTGKFCRVQSNYAVLQTILGSEIKLWRHKRNSIVGTWFLEQGTQIVPLRQLVKLRPTATRQRHPPATLDTKYIHALLFTDEA